jgi:hypothetical protein
MDEHLVAALAMVPGAIIVGLLGVQMRAGRWLNLINGIDLGKVRDREGLGQFAGTLMMAVAAVIAGMAAAMAVLPEAHLEVAVAIGTAAIIGIALRLAIGVRGFQRG